MPEARGLFFLAARPPAEVASVPMKLSQILIGAGAILLGGYVYFADSTAGGAASSACVQRVSLCAPGVAAPVGPVGIGPGDLAFDGQSLFFTSAQAAPSGSVGRLP